MKAYDAVCDCGTVTRHAREAAARHALRRHVCPARPFDLTPRHRCTSCGVLVPLLVDDGPLCLRCDALHHPS